MLLFFSIRFNLPRELAMRSFKLFYGNIKKYLDLFSSMPIFINILVYINLNESYH